MALAERCLDVWGEIPAVRESRTALNRFWFGAGAQVTLESYLLNTASMAAVNTLAVSAPEMSWFPMMNPGVPRTPS